MLLIEIILANVSNQLKLAVHVALIRLIHEQINAVAISICNKYCMPYICACCCIYLIYLAIIYRIIFVNSYIAI